MDAYAKGYGQLLCKGSATGFDRAGRGMNENPSETMAYRIAARMFESAFTACERLPEADRQFLLREIGERILKNISVPPTEAVKPVQIVSVEIRQQNSGDDGSN
jgi:hypothetical protein